MSAASTFERAEVITMKSIEIFLSLFLVAVAFTGCSQRTLVDSNDNSPDAIFQADIADKNIEKALIAITSAPGSPAGYTQLSGAYIRLGRETGNVQYNVKAEKAIDRALEFDPSNIAARKLKATLMLSFHRFADGLKLADELRAELPDDPFVYGLLTDAHDELGNYDDAVAAAQKMVDLKPNASSYARVGHVRSLHGDMKGAIEAFKLSARMTDPVDREGQSWCLVQIGNEYWTNGKYAQAERAYDEALANFPDYYLALAGKGRVLASENRFEAAADLLKRAQEKHLNLDTILLLGDVYLKLGDVQRANDQFSLAESGEATLGAANDPHRLALFWANRGQNVELALEIARLDYAKQKDIYAADTLAWCLYRTGQVVEAKRLVYEAMRLKTADAKIYYHAGMIEKALGNDRKASHFLSRALNLNPGFDLFQVEEARSALQKLRLTKS
jgi:tetratricopeptide (TPR) repeat protein